MWVREPACIHRVSGLDGHGHHGARHGRAQDAAGVFWNLLRHEGAQLSGQRGKDAHLELHTQRQRQRQRQTDRQTETIEMAIVFLPIMLIFSGLNLE